MMISDEMIAYFDILWFAVDNDGFLVMARSMESNVPEFVKRNSEKTENVAEEICRLKSYDRQRPQDFDLLAKELQCFYCICNNPYDDIYKVVSVPEQPANIRLFSQRLQDLLKDNRLPFSLKNTSAFEVKDGFVFKLEEKENS